MRIVYMGTPDFAVPALKALKEAGHEILLAVSQPDRPVGRHMELKPTPVKEAALSLGIPVRQPEKATDPEFIEEIRALSPDVMVVAAYGKILRPQLLSIPKYGCINIHGSLLPRWRGAAPIQWSVIEGDEKTGNTIMYMAEGMDTGDILMQQEIPIEDEDTGGSLFDKLAGMSGPLIVEALDLLEAGALVPQKQDESKATYAPQLTKEMGELDLSMERRKVFDRIRGLYPWPGTFMKTGGKLLKIHRAAMPDSSEEDRLKKAADVPAGTFAAGKDRLYLKCGDGFLRLLTVQAEGKKAMDAADFLRGSRQALGEVKEV